MKRGIFVTGTGTDVGKTYVSALLVKALRDRGVNAGYFKPALSGAVRKGDALVPGDCAYVCGIAGLPGPPEHYAACCYETAVSPHLAAQIEGRPVTLEHIEKRLRRVAEPFSFVVAEGCGGIFCPLDAGEPPLLLEDVAAAVGYPLVIVSPAGLGAINAAVLTAEYARRRGLEALAVILNGYDEGSFLHADNRRQIERFSGLPTVCVARDAAGIDTAFLGECV